ANRGGAGHCPSLPRLAPSRSGAGQGPAEPPGRVVVLARFVVREDAVLQDDPQLAAGVIDGAGRGHAAGRLTGVEFCVTAHTDGRADVARQRAALVGGGVADEEPAAATV